MGGPNQSRDTARFDPAELAELVKRADADVRNPDTEIAMARTSTVHDPLTTGLLAEASRRSRTIDLDEETVEQATSDKPVEQISPNVRRR